MCVARRALLASVGAALALLGATACLPGSRSAAPPVAEILDRSAAAMQGVTTVHVVMEMSGGQMQLAAGLTTSRVEGEVVAPDRARLKASTQAGNATLIMEYVTIGDRQYLADPFTRQWQALPAGAFVFEPLSSQRGAPAVIRTLGHPQLAGRVRIGGAETYHVRGQADPQRLAALTASEARPGQPPLPVQLWIGEADLLPRRIRLEGALAEGEPPGIVRTIDLGPYNRPVTIEPPL